MKTNKPRLLDLFCGAGGAALDLLPGSAVNDACHRLFVEAKVPRKLTLACSLKRHLSQLDNLALCEFRRWIEAAGIVSSFTATFRPHVPKVFNLTSQEEM